MDPKWEQLLRLRQRGVSYRNLALVAEAFWGWNFNGDQMRVMLRGMGAPADPTRRRYQPSETKTISRSTN